MERLSFEIHDQKGNVNICKDSKEAKQAARNGFIVIEVQESVFYTPDTVVRTTVSRQMQE